MSFLVFALSKMDVEQAKYFSDKSEAASVYFQKYGNIMLEDRPEMNVILRTCRQILT